eukprot:Gb_25149 [translate_table: standard]
MLSMRSYWLRCPAPPPRTAGATTSWEVASTAISASGGTNYRSCLRRFPRCRHEPTPTKPQYFPPDPTADPSRDPRTNSIVSVRWLGGCSTRDKFLRPRIAPDSSYSSFSRPELPRVSHCSVPSLLLAAPPSPPGNPPTESSIGLPFSSPFALRNTGGRLSHPTSLPRAYLLHWWRSYLIVESELTHSLKWKQDGPKRRSLSAENASPSVGGNSVPNAWQSLVELIHDFMPNLVNEQIGGLSGNVKQKFSPRISVTFTSSSFRNPQVGSQRNGLYFSSFSSPAGVPLPLAPPSVLPELIPHCSRASSSGIRLSANMMAGHSSVRISSGSTRTMPWGREQNEASLIPPTNRCAGTLSRKEWVGGSTGFTVPCGGYPIEPLVGGAGVPPMNNRSTHELVMMHNWTNRSDTSMDLVGVSPFSLSRLRKRRWDKLWGAEPGTPPPGGLLRADRDSFWVAFSVSYIGSYQPGPAIVNLGSLRVVLSAEELGPVTDLHKQGQKKNRDNSLGNEATSHHPTLEEALISQKKNVNETIGSQAIVIQKEPGDIIKVGAELKTELFKTTENDGKLEGNLLKRRTSDKKQIKSYKGSDSDSSSNGQSSAPNQDEVIRKQPEYELAWEFEMWRRSEEAKWKAELKDKEHKLIAALEEQWRKRDTDRMHEIDNTRIELATLESKLRAKLAALEKRERELVLAEETASIRREALNREYAQRASAAEVMFPTIPFCGFQTFYHARFHDQ